MGTMPLQLSSGQVAKRYGVSVRTLANRLNDKKLGFPGYVRLRDRRYWRIDELEAWERRRYTPLAQAA